jgi:DNA adenine methylase
MQSFFRYPGGKSKLKDVIIPQLNLYANNDIEYREPFFGGGGIGLDFLNCHPKLHNIWINDKDTGIACLWTSVIQFPEYLKQKVKNFIPSISQFDEFKKELTQNSLFPMQQNEIVEHGFKKLAIHQMSYSGLGTKSGGPLGGRRGLIQSVKYPINCRWSPTYICKKIDKIHTQLSRHTIKNQSCTCLDFENIISDNTNALIYLDPPYYIKGNSLYQCGLTVEDHQRLARLLKQSRHLWVLSYDDCEEIKKLYDWAHIQPINNVNYTITKSRQSPKIKSELLIYPRNFTL